MTVKFTSALLRDLADDEQIDGRPDAAEYLRSLARSLETLERFSVQRPEGMDEMEYQFRKAVTQ